MPSEKRSRETGLNALLSKNHAAKEYFLSLPDYVQGSIQQRSDNLHTIGELRRYAENLMAGDI